MPQKKSSTSSKITSKTGKTSLTPEQLQDLLSLEFRDWDHGDVPPEQVPNAGELLVRHAEQFLPLPPDYYEEVIELGNPQRFEM
jgi:hypothetical protein